MIGLSLPERYIMRRTLGSVLVLGAACLGLTISIDFLEALRQVGSQSDAGVATAFRLTLLRAPQLLMILSPFIMLFGVLMAFSQLARSLEIAVLRAAGFSVWRIVGAPVILAAILGVVLTLAVDPLTTRMSLSADRLLNDVKGDEQTASRAFRNGVWLRQDSNEGVVLFHADQIDLEAGVFKDVFVWRKSIEGVFLERFDAPTAVFEGQTVVLKDALRSTPGGQLAEEVGSRSFETSFAKRDLALLGTRPESLSIWTLPFLMQRIGNAGVPLEPYSLRLQELFAMPLKLASMAVIACVFALPIHARGGGTARLIIYGIVAGFLAFIGIQFSSALAEASLVPVVIAAWTPPAITLLVGVTIILFQEDG